jgi:hypothetical protein
MASVDNTGMVLGSRYTTDHIYTINDLTAEVWNAASIESNNNFYNVKSFDI